MDFQNTVPLDGAAARAAAPRGSASATASSHGLANALSPGTSHAESARAPHGEAASPGSDAATRDGEPVTIRFTGSGSEYFRIWIVNLLLMLVTLGFYYPFAKARRLRYFHDNTIVGEHALGFHGDPMKMLRGYLLMLLFGGCYAGAGYFSPIAGVVAALVFAAMWPLLWRASLRFRLANTSWRGLRLRFSGSTADAYRALLPLLLPGALFVAISASQRGATPETASAALGVVMGLSALTVMALWPMGLAWIKRYQHGHYHYATEHSRLEAKTSAFYGIWLVMILISLLPFGAMMALVLGSTAIAVAAGGKFTVAIVMSVIGVVGFYLSLFFISQPYFSAKVQNLVWTGTRSHHLRFESELRFRALAWLSFKNFMLMVVTLGLYRPFAAIHTARLRLEAVQLRISGDITQWASTAGRFDDAAGDAAGDLLGIDIGL